MPKLPLYLLLCLPWISAGGTPLRLTVLGTLEKNGSSLALGISADGTTIVGSSWNSVLRRNVPAFWGRDGKAVGLGITAPETVGYFDADGEASSTSGHGEVIAGTFGGHPFRWTRSKGVEWMDTTVLWGGYARSVSGDGKVVVGQAREWWDGEAFRWDSSGEQVLNAIDLPDTQPGNAFGLNEDGSLIVGSANGPDGGPHAVMWTAGLGLTILPNPGNDDSRSEARSIAGKWVTGWADSDDGTQAVVWNLDDVGNREMLESPAGGYNGVATAVAANGSVIAGKAEFLLDSQGFIVSVPSLALSSQADYTYPDDYSSEQGMIWDSAGKVHWLADVLTASGIRGWTISNITGISADGTVLVGNGVDSKRRNQAWVIRNFSFPKKGSATERTLKRLEAVRALKAHPRGF